MPHYEDMISQDLKQLEKAFTYGDQGAAILQTIVPPTVARLMDFMNPLRMNLSRKYQKGDYAFRYMRRSQNSPVAAENIAETGSFTAYNGTYDQMIFPFKIFGGAFRAYQKLIATSANLLDVVMEELEARVLEMKDFEDYQFVRGVCSATEIEGLETLITTNQSVAMTTTSGGSALTLAKLDEAIDQCKAPIEQCIMVMSRATARALNGLLQPYQQFANIDVEVKGGFRVPVYNHIPIFRSTNMPDTQSFNGSTNTDQTSGSNSSIFIIGTQDVGICLLDEILFKEMAQTNITYREWQTMWQQVLYLKNPLNVSKLWGIKN